MTIILMFRVPPALHECLQALKLVFSLFVLEYPPWADNIFVNSFVMIITELELYDYIACPISPDFQCPPMIVNIMLSSTLLLYVTDNLTHWDYIFQIQVVCPTSGDYCSILKIYGRIFIPDKLFFICQPS